MSFRFGRISAAGWIPWIFRSPARSDAHADLSADTLRWKRKAVRHEITIKRLKAALQRARSRYHDLHTRFEARRQSSLDHGVLRQVLAVRAAQLPVSACERQAAAARDACLQERSAAYRQAIHGTAPSTELQRIEIDGLPWWVPLDHSNEERVRRSQRQGFPYRAILQTREVAIGGIMLDIGANIGRTSIPRIILGDVRAVYAAEPEPANYACLVRNTLEHNVRGLVLPDCVAIGATRGEAQMRRSRYPGGHRVLHGDETDTGSILVQVWPLDKWVVQLGIDAGAVTFVKTDTQGSELNVLRGAPSLLARKHVSWLIEIDPGLLRRADTIVTDLLGLLQHHFSHFIDIGSPEPGPRVRPTVQLAESVSYLGTRQKKTDLLLFHGA
jgi:FkbM family methyltransferase